MAVRLKDIARDLGVSTMTVSKALRGDRDIGATTRARVERRARELGYQPDRAARALVGGRSGAIGLVVPDLVHPFFAEVARAMGRVLRARQHALVIASSEEDPAIERQAIELMLAQRVDALVIASVARSSEFFRLLEQRKLPHVLIDRRVRGVRAPFVGIDDEQVGFLATDHLARVGCRRIAHISGPAVTTGAGRLAGYRRALQAHGLPHDPGLVVRARSGDVDTQPSGAEAMRRLLTSAPPPDGLFCFNDPIALGAMSEAMAAGLRVPEDLAVVGCANLFYDELLRVPLTSVDQCCQEMAERAAQLALFPPVGDTTPELLAPRLVARASSARRGAAEMAAT